MLLLSVVAFAFSDSLRMTNLYPALMAAERAWMLGTLPAYYVRAEHFAPGGVKVLVYHPRGEEAAAHATASLVARYLPAVASDLGLSRDQVPGLVSVVISPSRQAMIRFLGKRYGTSALGAYWRGVIWLLSPRAWLDTERPGWEAHYEAEGPVIHELTHLLLDRVSAGRITPWLDEGLAQWEEYSSTGFQWAEDALGPGREPYSLAALRGRFHSLPDEARAYRQAFLVMRYMVERYGEGAPAGIVDALAKGREDAQAIQQVTGRDLAVLEREWRAWFRVAEED